MSNSSLISYTKLSPNHSGKRTKKIDTVTIHCMAGQLSVESCGALFAKSSKGASSNYGIGPDGRIALYVDESNRSWCTSSNANGQTWECYQAHDNATYPDIKPDNAAWYTFWRPLHGKTPETARPFVPVQGAHDIYRTGEFMIWTDGNMYECVDPNGTAYSPADYAQAWKLIPKN